MSPSHTGANLWWQGVWEQKESCGNWTRNWLESISRQVIDINELPFRRHAKLLHILCTIDAIRPIIAVREMHVVARKTDQLHTINEINRTFILLSHYTISFSTLMLLVGWQKEHMACEESLCHRFPKILFQNKVDEDNQGEPTKHWKTAEKWTECGNQHRESKDQPNLASCKFHVHQPFW